MPARRLTIARRAIRSRHALVLPVSLSGVMLMLVASATTLAAPATPCRWAFPAAVPRTVQAARDVGPSRGGTSHLPIPGAAHGSRGPPAATLALHMVRYLETFFRHRVLFAVP